MPERLTPEQISQRVAKLIEAVQEKLRQIEDAHETQRAAVIAESGLPPELVARILGPSESRLTSPDNIDKNEEMAQVQSEGSPRKRGRPLNVKDAGPYARAALKLGMSGVDLARALDVKYATAMNWDRDDRRIPDDAQAKIDKLLAAKEKADARAKGK